MATQNRDGGSFLTGFGVGVLAGAVGYLLQKTEYADDFRSQFKNEWERAEEFVRHELVSVAPSSVSAAFSEVIEYLAEGPQQRTAKPNSSTSSQPKSAKKSTKFKGV